MASIIKAEVTTNSADDKMGRVRLKSEGVWNQETELVQSVNGCSLSKGDIVFVSVIDGYLNPLILGKAERNEIVLNLLVQQINKLEDKVNELIDKQNDVIQKLSMSSAVVEGTMWSAATAIFLPMVAKPLVKLPQKTKLRDIQDNYK